MKTPWYPGTIKPVRKGWYECKNHFNEVQMDWWNGKMWCWGPNSSAYPNGQQDWMWRGVVGVLRVR